jgi:hypothetical protein
MSTDKLMKRFTQEELEKFQYDLGFDHLDDNDPGFLTVLFLEYLGRKLVPEMIKEDFFFDPRKRGNLKKTRMLYQICEKRFDDLGGIDDNDIETNVLLRRWFLSRLVRLINENQTTKIPST